MRDSVHKFPAEMGHKGSPSDQCEQCGVARMHAGYACSPEARRVELLENTLCSVRELMEIEFYDTAMAMIDEVINPQVTGRTCASCHELVEPDTNSRTGWTHVEPWTPASKDYWCEGRAYPAYIHKPPTVPANIP